MTKFWRKRLSPDAVYVSSEGIFVKKIKRKRLSPDAVYVSSEGILGKKPHKKTTKSWSTQLILRYVYEAIIVYRKSLLSFRWDIWFDNPNPVYVSSEGIFVKKIKRKRLSWCCLCIIRRNFCEKNKKKTIKSWCCLCIIKRNFWEKNKKKTTKSWCCLCIIRSNFWEKNKKKMTKFWRKRLSPDAVYVSSEGIFEKKIKRKWLSSDEND